MSTSMPHASSPHRLPHTCIFPCMKTISKTKDFCFSSCEGSLDRLRYFFHWTNSDNTVDNPLIYLYWTNSDNYGGQPSDKNRLFKAIPCTHTRYTRCPHAREMQCYCMVFTYLHACMYQYHSHKTACYSAKK